MSQTQLLTVTDDTTFTIKETDLNHECEECFTTPKRTVPCSNGLKWWIAWYPAGAENTSHRYVSIYMTVNKAVACTYSFQIVSTSIEFSATYTFTDCDGGAGHGRQKFVSHNSLRSLFRDGKVDVICKVTFGFDPPPPSAFVPRMFRCCGHVETDATFVVGQNELQVHKSFLSLLSPVFHAMFSHNTAELWSGKVHITDFDFTTVKSAINLCYGRGLTSTSDSVIIGVLRFADKYDIKDITEHLEQPFIESMTIDNFCPVVSYAWECSRDELKNTCAQFLNDNRNEVTSLKAFLDIDPNIVHELLTLAYILKN